MSARGVELEPMGAGWEGILPGEAELGLIVHPTHWDRGIATEAAGLVAVDCFTRAGLRPPSDRRRSIGSAVVEVALRNGHPPPRLRADERLAAV